MSKGHILAAENPCTYALSLTQRVCAWAVDSLRLGLYF